MPRPAIQAVFLDVGETIVDESGVYGDWADWLGVPRHTFSAVMGAVIARGGDHLETFRQFKPDFDLTAEWARRVAGGRPEIWGEESLYPDARPCLEALRAMGLRVGLAGNQTREAEAILRSLVLPVDVLGTSAAWGVEKPSAAFFERVVTEADCPAPSVLYVGDRIDNDIAPAQSAGLSTAFIRRGPWGHIARNPRIEARCLFLLDDLVSLPALIRRHTAGE
jgi:HAD superfamily hydrolase (TIGR01549 family)